jgi:RNase P subunit RPR2
MILAPPQHWRFFRCERCHQPLGLVALGRYTMDPERAECVGDDLGLVVKCRECGHENTWHPVPSRV